MLLVAGATALAAACAAACAAAAPGARSIDPTVEGADRAYAVVRAASAADDGAAAGAQARYDAARDLQEELFVRVPRDCVRLRDALRRVADAEIAATEAFDRLDVATRGAAVRRSARAVGAVTAARASCRGRRPLEPSTPLRPPLADLSRLPPAALAVPTPRADAALAGRIAALGRGFRGYAAISVTDLARRRTAAWNERARFPAASTVKIGVLAAALRRFRGAERARIGHDLRAIARWSSNLAANRLYGLLGRTAIEEALRRLGASSSSYTGAYRAGTARRAPALEPPLVSQRVTTARDLDAILRTLLGAAAGRRAALMAAGLQRADARVALGLLLAADGHGDNAGLVAPFLPPGTPVAQKNGWLSSARHTAAIAFTDRGPVIVVVLTYRQGLSLAEAQALGRRVVAAALR